MGKLPRALDCPYGKGPRRWPHGVRHGDAFQAVGVGSDHFARAVRRPRRLRAFQRDRDGRLPCSGDRRRGRVRLPRSAAGQLPLRCTGTERGAIAVAPVVYKTTASWIGLLIITIVTAVVTPNWSTSSPPAILRSIWVRSSTVSASPPFPRSEPASAGPCRPAPPRRHSRHETQPNTGHARR